MKRFIYLSSLSIDVEHKAGDPRFLGRDRAWLGRLWAGAEAFNYCFCVAGEVCAAGAFVAGCFDAGVPPRRS
jgi:hypothetical protein